MVIEHFEKVGTLFDQFEFRFEILSDFFSLLSKQWTFVSKKKLSNAKIFFLVGVKKEWFVLALKFLPWKKFWKHMKWKTRVVVEQDSC